MMKIADEYKTFITNSEEETENAAQSMSALFKPGDVIALVGELGAGKTCFVRGLVKGLGSTDLVNSPTFTLVNQYQGKMPIYHFDVYRLNDTMEIEDLDIDHYFYNQGVCIIEWAEKASLFLPDDYWSITIKIKNHQERIITVKRQVKKAD